MILCITAACPSTQYVKMFSRHKQGKEIVNPLSNSILKTSLSGRISQSHNLEVAQTLAHSALTNKDSLLLCLGKKLSPALELGSDLYFLKAPHFTLQNNSKVQPFSLCCASAQDHTHWGFQIAKFFHSGCAEGTRGQ